MKKIVLVIIDGIGDEFVPELHGTPLEYVSDKLENLNRMAKEGMCGIMHVIAPGIPPSSDTAHFTIFGYDLSKEYTGRGYFEALGAGIPIEEGDVALRFNFATVEKKGKYLYIVDRRAGRISGEAAEELAKALQEAVDEKGLPVKIYHTLEHRGVLVIKSLEKLSRMVCDTDPHEVGCPVLASEPLEETPPEEMESARRTAEIINEVTRLSYKVLENHPINREREEKGLLKANVILARGAGIAIKLKPFEEKWGLKPAYVAAGPLYKGVARAAGMDEIHVPGATGTVHTDLNGKVRGVIKALDEGYDFVFLHVKAVDNLSHDKKPKEKALFISRIDATLGELLELEDTVIAVTGDHSTSSVLGRHVGLPTPIVFWSKRNVRRDHANRFTENECAEKGCLGTIYGRNVMPLLLDLANRSMEFGLRPSPKHVLYFGAFGKPLEM